MTDNSNSLETVAVIIPSFNRCALLPRALDSVLAQTRAADEIWVIDDGSTDGTAAMLADSYPMVRLIEQPNRGVSAARNAGIRATQCRWLALLDSDDVWRPTKLARQLAAAREAGDHRLVHCDETWLYRGKHKNQKSKHAKQGGDLFQQSLAMCAISPSAALLRSDLFEGHGFFDEKLPACEDYELWLRITAHEPVLLVDEALVVKHGGHADQLSQRHWGMDRFRVQALEKLLASQRLSKRQQAQALDTLVEKCRVLALGARKRQRNERAAYFERLAAQAQDHYRAQPSRAYSEQRLRNDVATR